MPVRRNVRVKGAVYIRTNAKTLRYLTAGELFRWRDELKAIEDGARQRINLGCL